MILRHHTVRVVNPQAPANQNANQRLVLGMIGLIILTFLIYLPALTAGFIWDDDSMLTGNLFVKTKDGLRYIWFSTNLPDYFPLTSTSFWIEWKLWGDNPVGYHFINVLLHVASSILIWRVLVTMNIPGAFVAALLFAVHPVNVESVAWIAERKNTLSLFFLLLAILFFLKSTGLSGEGEKQTAGSGQFYVLSLGAFLMSLLSKTGGVLLPFVLLLCLWWIKKRITRKDVFRTLPFFIPAAVFGVITIWFQYRRAIGADVVVTRSLVTKIIIACKAVWFYLAKILWPANLSFVYPFWEINERSLVAYLPTIFLLAILAGLFLSKKREAKAALFSFACFLLLLSPVLGFFKIYFQRYSMVADHWQYFAMICIVALGAAALNKLRSLPGGHSLHVFTVFNVIAVLSCLSWRQCGIYKNPETLWRDTLAKNPACWLAHNEFGLLLVQQGKVAEAVSHYEQSLKAQPEQQEAYNNIGTIYLISISVIRFIVRAKIKRPFRNIIRRCD